MYTQLQTLAARFGIPAETLMVIGVSIGMLLAFLGIAALLAEKNIAAVRIAAASNPMRARMDRGLLRAPDAGPKGLMKTFIPSDARERSELQIKLAQAGYPHAAALRNFTLVRMLLGVVMPGIFIALIVVSKQPGIVLPFDLVPRLSKLTNYQIFQVLSILVGVGYFGPIYWLRGRMSARQQRIQQAFPNALDLMQISVEAGLGFDAAMTRVGNELADISPEIAFEFLSVQRQVQAGRDRSTAMLDMAQRTGVDTVRSFANVVQQSMQFGTSMSDALTTYANEMREYRELKAQEMANKLPVKLSAVMASLMLPALIILTVGPVIIRYVRYFGDKG